MISCLTNVLFIIEKSWFLFMMTNCLPVGGLIIPVCQTFGGAYQNRKHNILAWSSM